jgi:hypothetical protein
MRLTRQLPLLSLIWILSSNAGADALKDKTEARKLTDRIMAKVGQGDVIGGIGLAQPFLIVPPAEFDVMVDQLKMQQPVMAQRFGKTIGHEFLQEERVGENLLRIIHLHRFEKHAMRWSFYFYRGSEGWTLNTFRTDDQIPQLFGN